eukprot:TRINITY_DN3484_c0_g1_i4.p1 TRINITY_DN3484_c0_g1~~TRINITY_DN3484_c0_g1_i4.p1  ORF type:complete len:121 (-),score=17.13 TRINITY_DN3484_c0_g1_i4:225-587(-)
MKKYHCDFCNKSFNASRWERKKHRESRHHQTLVKLHYDSFKDPSRLLPPCPQFFTMGYCSLGDACTCSHSEPRDTGGSAFLPWVGVRPTAPRLQDLPPSMQQPPQVSGWDYAPFSDVDWG